MKYTTKVKKAQLVGGVKIEPPGGDLKEAQVKAITADPYGVDLIKKKYLDIEGVKPEQLEMPRKKGGMSTKQGYKPPAKAAEKPTDPTGSGKGDGK